MRELEIGRYLNEVLITMIVVTGLACGLFLISTNARGCEASTRARETRVATEWAKMQKECVKHHAPHECERLVAPR